MYGGCQLTVLLRPMPSAYTHCSLGRHRLQVALHSRPVFALAIVRYRGYYRNSFAPSSVNLYILVRCLCIVTSIAISSSPSTSKGGTAARNAAESYEASAGLYRYTLADYQSPSTTYGGAATPAGCNSLHLATMSSGPSNSNLYKE